MTNLTDAQLSKAMDKIEQELHAIIFMYKTDRHKYGNILDQMENDVLQKKDPFPKTVSEASLLIEGWKGKSNNNHYNRYKKYDLNKIVRVKNNLIKTVKQPSCELSNKKVHYSN